MANVRLSNQAKARSVTNDLACAERMIFMSGLRPSANCKDELRQSRANPCLHAGRLRKRWRSLARCCVGIQDLDGVAGSALPSEGV